MVIQNTTLTFFIKAIPINIFRIPLAIPKKNEPETVQNIIAIIAVKICILPAIFHQFIKITFFLA